MRRFSIKRWMGFIFLITVALLFTGCKKQEEPKSFAWVLTKEGSQNEMTFFGSIPVINEEKVTITEIVQEKIREAEQLIIEADSTKFTPNEQEDLALQYGVYDPEDSLAKHISEPLYQAIEEKGKSINEQMVISQYKPWLLNYIIAQDAFQKLGYYSQNQLDEYIESKFEAKNRLELEPLEERLQKFSGYDKSLNELMIKDALLVPENFKQRVDEMILAWKQGDVVGMEKAVYQNLIKDPSLKPLYDEIYFSRVNAFSTQLEKAFNENKNVFVNLKAGYLVGEKGLIKRFEEMGYTVEQI